VVQDFAEALVRKDAKRVLERVEEVFNRGTDLKRLTEELALQLRHLFVAKTLGEAPTELSESERTALTALAKDADSAQISRLFDIVHGSVWEVSRAPQPRLALEMALLKAIQLSPAGSIPELLARVDRLSAGLGGSDDARKVATGAPGGRSSSANFRSH
jgi:DNA polymerase-3 subunit gamma/tau